MPITPNGTRIFPTNNPLGLLHIWTISPTGSDRAAISCKPAAISFIRLGLRVKRSIMADDNPLSLTPAISFRLASSKYSPFCSNLPAIFSKARSFALEDTFAIHLAALRASWASFKTSCLISINIPPHQVILSEAKNLNPHRLRPFATLRVTDGQSPCISEQYQIIPVNYLVIKFIAKNLLYLFRITAFNSL